MTCAIFHLYLVSVSKCSTSLLTNSSYILNPNFPNSFNNPGTCTYYIHKENDNGDKITKFRSFLIKRFNAVSCECSIGISLMHYIFIGMIFLSFFLQFDLFFNTLVCQFRLDFKQFSLTNPPSTGDCSTVDSMVISTSGQLTPMICGKNISEIL